MNKQLQTANVKQDRPVYSMTGYASSTLADGRLSVDCRSVNSRFLDLQIKVPDSLRQMEAPCREWLTAQVKRGKCELRLQTVKNTSALPLNEWTSSQWQTLAQQQQVLLSAFPAAQPLSVAELMAWQKNSQSADESVPSDMQVLTLVKDVIQQFLQARASEGEKLKAAMLQATAQLRQLQMQALPLIPALVEQQRQKFIEKFQQALSELGQAGNPISVQAMQDKALSEATAFAIRIDVQEEVTRLGAHLEEIDKLLLHGGDVGKRLEFLIQELHREANTFGSKSAQLETSRIAMDMKVLIEQLREQVQNIE